MNEAKKLPDMTKDVAEKMDRLLSELEGLQSSGLKRERIQSKVLSSIDILSRSKEGLNQLYAHVRVICDSGLLEGTSWEDPEKLVPTLVKGTLSSGFPMIIYETMSELRMLKLAMGELEDDNFSQQEAQSFLREALIGSFELIFENGSEELRMKLTKNERQRIHLLFDFILGHYPLENILDRLSLEVRIISGQRPIKTDRLRRLLKLVRDNVDLSGGGEDRDSLKYYVNALYQPTNQVKQHPSIGEYRNFLDAASSEQLVSEAKEMGIIMDATGLVSAFHVLLVKKLAISRPKALGFALALDSHGKADLERHEDFVISIIQRFVREDHKQVIYGLGKLLNRNLLSRKAVYNALNKLFTIRLHSDVERLLVKSRQSNAEIDPKDMLCGGVIRLLGQPLGVGQGLNPTCQSARGLSMWSRHSPEKLLNMIINAAVANTLSFRYEGEIIDATGVINEQVFDFNLDPVSVVLVPHLDSIYQQMMQRAQLKHPGQDPHVSVNPAFYGHWIQTGFTSCYNPLTNMIVGYENFVKLFYASFHPEFNGGFKLIYPIPLGIFITTSQAEFLGFHAVSLLRVAQNQAGEWRAYFFNPNNEGRQNWGQEIVPTVSSNQEKAGESSLPFYQFVSRVYAYHYNALEAPSNMEQLEIKDYPAVEKLAKESWGQNYYWD